MKMKQIEKKTIAKAGNLSWWQVALITLGVSFLGGLSAILSRKKQRKVYTSELKQAPWAPPSWVFSPAWTVNNYFIVQALKELLSKEKLSNRKQLLYLQVGIWLIYFTFGYVYFKKKSPILAAIWTNTDAALAITSFILAAKSNRKLFWNYLPLSLWTLYAGSVADYQALKNPDQLLGTKPILPQPSLN